MEHTDFCNELEALKCQLINRMTSGGVKKGSTSVCYKRKAVDLPVTPQVFKKFFLSLFPGNVQRRTKSKQIKTEVSSDSLAEVFGKNWQIFRFPNSSTQIKVIGNVVLLYRMKVARCDWTFRYISFYFAG